MNFFDSPMRNTLPGMLRGTALLAAVSCLLIVDRPAVADTFDSPAVESSVIASGLPDMNLMLRNFSNIGVSKTNNLLMNTSDILYPNPSAGEASQEYFLFKFDFDEFDLPSGATITSAGTFNWTTWFTNPGVEDPDGQEVLGEFEFYEITAGDADWEGNQFSDGTVSPGAVTFNNLGGTFTKLDGVFEVDTGQGQPLVPGKLISDGDNSDRQSVGGIPAATLERLRSGQSIGLAMGSVSPTVFSIHSHTTFLADQNKEPRLVFDFTTGAVSDPADFDDDGDVDAADLATWQGSYGANGDGDTDLDGDTDGLDLLTWQRNFTGPAVIVSVPEPTAACLAGLVLSMLATCDRRRGVA